MENHALIELSETELDKVYGGAGRVVSCAQSADTSCAQSCCSSASTN